MLSWLLAALVTDNPSASPTPDPPAATQSLEIIRSHSHRIPGFHLAVDDSGTVRVMDEGGKMLREVHLSPQMTSMFFMSAQMAAPSITGLQAEPCDRHAASEGETYLRFDGVQSPDLSCNKAGVLKALWSLTKQVMSMLGLNNYLGGLGGSILPQDSSSK
jgi:hypothetical protein